LYSILCQAGGLTDSSDSAQLEYGQLRLREFGCKETAMVSSWHYCITIMIATRYLSGLQLHFSLVQDGDDQKKMIQVQKEQQCQA
jgi:hypothetical protein